MKQRTELQPRQPLCKWVSAKVTEQEYIAVIKFCKSHQVTISDLVRHALSQIITEKK